MNKTLTALIAAAGTSTADRIFDVQYLTWPLLIAAILYGCYTIILLLEAKAYKDEVTSNVTS